MFEDAHKNEPVWDKQVLSLLLVAHVRKDEKCSCDYEAWERNQ